ncbi:MAG: hypothetical protein JRN15_23575 [Nitrososphaerota archaeon]|nr:hypothetical protein [Nitrososphaerota archaeon]
MLASEDEEAQILKLSMKTLKEHYGLNPGKHAKTVRGIGYQLGAELANRLHSSELKMVISELSEYWKRNEIGEMEWEDESEGLLSVNFCSDCLSRSYGVGYALCPFKEGLLEAVLSSRLSQKYKVTEVACCGTLASGCSFKLEKTQQ